MADRDWRDHINEALQRVAKSPFCRGQSERGWRADIDWMLRPDTLTKITEGKYDDHADGSGHIAGDDLPQLTAPTEIVT